MNFTPTKDQIDYLKKDENAFLYFTQNQNDGVIVHVLGKLGKLSDDCIRKPLLELLQSSNPAIRTLAIKNLAKLSDTSLIDTFIDQGKNDQSAEVRKESVSAIGRLKNEEAIPVLINFLYDNDPSVVLQALRGLLVFPITSQIFRELVILKEHPNEIIQDLINQKLQSRKKIRKNILPHDQFPEFLENLVVEGDVVKIMEFVPNESVHLTFTSPPYYNARDYSIYRSYKEYLAFLEKVFSEIHRITHLGRFLIVNTSPIIISRISRAHSSKRYPIPFDLHPLIVNSGWEYIDDIVWVKPMASVKNRNAGFYQHRKPLAYKPNAVTEMLMVYRKKTHKLIDWNMRQYSFDKTKASKIDGEYEMTNVWQIDPTSDKVHSAVFPLELCNRVIQYYSYVEDLVFDPFAGSGTLGQAAIALNRNFFLTEVEPKYVVRMKEKLNLEANLFDRDQQKIQIIDLKSFIKLSNRYKNRVYKNQVELKQ